MSDKQKPFVIAISAVSGGGKTTVIQHLSQVLRNSKALYFDDYEFGGAPEDICEWVENGGDSNDWNLSPLIEGVQFLITEHLPPLDYILLDYPFAYKHKGMKPFIDFTIFIDTPLDIAMARRILRDFSDGSIEEVKEDMQHYLMRGRFAYADMLRTTKPGSDVVIDGSLTLEAITDMIILEVKKRIQQTYPTP